MKRPFARWQRAVFVSIGLIFVASPSTWAGEEPPSTQSASDVVLPEAHHPRLGERLGFQGRWMGIPVGSGWIEVKELVTIDDRQAIHIEAQGYTNQVLSKVYPIHDVIHSYLDADTLKPLRFEKNQHEGHYRANEVVTFDHEHARATYRSLLNNSVKEIPLPESVQDLISALYWFRAQPLRPGQSVTVDLYTDEKIYSTTVQVSQPTTLELLKRGTFSCLIVEPHASFKGLLVRRGRLWAYMTTDERRLPLLIKATTPWGPMSAVIEEASIPPCGESGKSGKPVDADPC